jgi:hypothetical protein
LLDRGQDHAAVILGNLAASIEPRNHPWILTACAVGLVLLPQFFGHASGPLAQARRPGRIDSRYEAAIHAGASRLRAWALGWRVSVVPAVCRFALIWALAATNITPALLFAAGSDRKTLGPAFLNLASGDSLERSQAAALAVAAILANLTAIAATSWSARAHGGRDFAWGRG